MRRECFGTAVTLLCTFGSAKVPKPPTHFQLHFGRDGLHHTGRKTSHSRPTKPQSFKVRSPHRQFTAYVCNKQTFGVAQRTPFGRHKSDRPNSLLTPKRRAAAGNSRCGARTDASLHFWFGKSAKTAHSFSAPLRSRRSTSHQAKKQVFVHRQSLSLSRCALRSAESRGGYLISTQALYLRYKNCHRHMHSIVRLSAAKTAQR